MQRSVHPSRTLRGTIVPPGDKSVSHRAAILNAIAAGPAVVENFQRGADCLATLRCLRLLGVDWEWGGETALRGAGRGAGLRQLRDDHAPPERAAGWPVLLLRADGRRLAAVAAHGADHRAAA